MKIKYLYLFIIMNLMIIIPLLFIGIKFRNEKLGAENYLINTQLYPISGETQQTEEVSPDVGSSSNVHQSLVFVQVILVVLLLSFVAIRSNNRRRKYSRHRIHNRKGLRKLS